MGTKEPRLHTKILNDAAKKYLGPLGLVQKGRSRFWLDDRKWFVIGVEFQPSSWSRGSYLNMGCNWLWMPRDYFAYDVDERIGTFTPFHDSQQFEIAAIEMARRASDQVLRYRALFDKNLEAICDYYSQTHNDNLWPNFNQAIAFALLGDKHQADHFFTKVITFNEEAVWAREARSDAERLYALSEDDSAFRAAINERIQKARALQRLPQLQALPF